MRYAPAKISRLVRLLTLNYTGPRVAGCGYSPSTQKNKQNSSYPMPEIELQLDHVTPELSFSINEGKVWLNEQRIILFSQAALGKFRREVVDTIGLERAKPFFLRLGFQLGKVDGELARNSSQFESLTEKFLIGPELHALRGMVLPKLRRLLLSDSPEDFVCEVEWHNSWEVGVARVELPDLQEPACWTLVGYASGYSTYFTGSEIYFEEIECGACGFDTCFAVGRHISKCNDPQIQRDYYKPDSVVTELNALKRRIDDFAEQDKLQHPLTDIVGVSKPFQEALNMVTRAGDSKVSVLLLGETGVGKEVMARALHQSGDRANMPFVSVNCAAIPQDLIESELFGVAKGAFTGATAARAGKFERADGGTIFLDEVVELSARAQASLLRVLQEKEVERLGDGTVRKIDVRVVAATNEDLGQAVKENRFRADLFYRLSAFPVTIPSLRERQDDIPLFLDFFIKKYSSEYGKKISGVSDKSLDLLMRYDWPGNIRELENVIERAIILTDQHDSINLDAVLSPSMPGNFADDHELGKHGQLVRADDQRSSIGIDGVVDYLIDTGTAIDELESALIRVAMQRAGGSVSKAARLVGMTRPAFAYRLSKDKQEEKVIT